MKNDSMLARFMLSFLIPCMFASCIMDSDDGKLIAFADELTVEQQSRHLHILRYPDCSPCRQYLADRMKSDVLYEAHFVILTDNVRNTDIHLQDQYPGIYTLVPSTSYPEISRLVADDVITLSRHSNHISRTPASTFYVQSMPTISHLDTFERIATLEVFPYKHLYLTDVKRFGSMYFAKIIGNDEYDRTKVGIIYCLSENDCRYLDKDKFAAAGHEYMSGLVDFDLDGDTLFILSRYELIYYSLREERILYQRTIDLPTDQYCSNDRSHDFGVSGQRVLIPIENCMNSRYSAKKYVQTEYSHMLLDRESGAVVAYLGRVPARYTMDNSIMINWSVAGRKGSCVHIFYPFTKTERSHVYPDSCQPIVLDPGLQFRELVFGDSAVKSMIDRSEMLAKQQIDSFGNATYRNLLLSEHRVCLDIEPGLQYDSYSFFRFSDSTRHIDTYRGDEYKWVENAEGDLIFFNFDKDNIYVYQAK